MNTSEKILRRMLQANTLLCVGLDPDLRQLPATIRQLSISDEEKVFRFLTGVIDVTGQHVCAYKAQKAFFDLLSGGHELLKQVIAYAHAKHPDVSVILDCKIGDIDNTMTAYAVNVFDKLQADGVVVNPYLGEDVIRPLTEYRDKAIVVLAKTSNVGGSIIQDVSLHTGEPLWQYVLNLIVNRWNDHGNMIPVIAATADLDMHAVRQQIPDQMPILLAGVGAQGGSTNVDQLLNSSGVGVFVNSSRGILYHSTSGSWTTTIEAAAIALKDALNHNRRKA